eukprot:g5823.t1
MFAYIRASMQGAFERVKKSINGEAFDVVEFCQGSSVNRLVVIEFLGHEYDFMDDKSLVKPGEELIGGDADKFRHQFDTRIVFPYRYLIEDLCKRNPRNDPKLAKALRSMNNGANPPGSRASGRTSDSDFLDTDAGWGCMVRVMQMMLGEAIRRAQAQPTRFDWKNNLETLCEVRDEVTEKFFARLFYDRPEAPFGLHAFCRVGNVSFGKEVGSWFGPTSAAMTAALLVNACSARDKNFCGFEGLRAVCFNDGPVYEDELKAAFRAGGVGLSPAPSPKSTTTREGGEPSSGSTTPRARPRRLVRAEGSAPEASSSSAKANVEDEDDEHEMVGDLKARIADGMQAVPLSSVRGPDFQNSGAEALVDERETPRSDRTDNLSSALDTPPDSSRTTGGADVDEQEPGGRGPGRSPDSTPRSGSRAWPRNEGSAGPAVVVGNAVIGAGSSSPTAPSTRETGAGSKEKEHKEKKEKKDKKESKREEPREGGEREHTKKAEKSEKKKKSSEVRNDASDREHKKEKKKHRDSSRGDSTPQSTSPRGAGHVEFWSMTNQKKSPKGSETASPRSELVYVSGGDMKTPSSSAARLTMQSFGAANMPSGAPTSASQQPGSQVSGHSSGSAAGNKVVVVTGLPTARQPQLATSTTAATHVTPKGAPTTIPAAASPPAKTLNTSDHLPSALIPPVQKVDKGRDDQQTREKSDELRKETSDPANLPKAAQEQLTQNRVIFWVCRKLGRTDDDSSRSSSGNYVQYQSAISSLFKLPEFLGIASGNEGVSAHWFTGCVFCTTDATKSTSESLLYYDMEGPAAGPVIYDPHCIVLDKLTKENASDYGDLEKRAYLARKCCGQLPFANLNSSLAFGFLVNSWEHWLHLKKRISKIKQGLELIEIMKEKPKPYTGSMMSSSQNNPGTDFDDALDGQEWMIH